MNEPDKLRAEPGSAERNARCAPTTETREVGS
jgi:hypothetical protein